MYLFSFWNTQRQANVNRNAKIAQELKEKNKKQDYEMKWNCKMKSRNCVMVWFLLFICSLLISKWISFIFFALLLYIFPPLYCCYCSRKVSVVCRFDFEKRRRKKSAKNNIIVGRKCGKISLNLFKIIVIKCYYKRQNNSVRY